MERTSLGLDFRHFLHMFPSAESFRTLANRGILYAYNPNAHKVLAKLHACNKQLIIMNVRCKVPWPFFEGSHKGGSQKGGFGGCSPVPKQGTRVHSDLPRYQRAERRYIRMFPGTKNRNEGTFAKTALLRNRPLFPLDIFFLPQTSCINIDELQRKSAINPEIASINCEFPSVFCGNPHCPPSNWHPQCGLSAQFPAKKWPGNWTPKEWIEGSLEIFL